MQPFGIATSSLIKDPAPTSHAPVLDPYTIRQGGTSVSNGTTSFPIDVTREAQPAQSRPVARSDAVFR